MVWTDIRKIYWNPGDWHQFFIIKISSVSTISTSNLGCSSWTMMFTKICTACVTSLVVNGEAYWDWDRSEEEGVADSQMGAGVSLLLLRRSFIPHHWLNEHQGSNKLGRISLLPSAWPIRCMHLIWYLGHSASEPDKLGYCFDFTLGKASGME